MNKKLTEEILTFWFGTANDTKTTAHTQSALWWGKDTNTDQEIAQRFAPHVQAALQGDYETWANEARGRLALIILLDQFTRVIYRDSANAYCGDQKALSLTQAGLALAHDQALRPVERVFFYLPLEHAEDLTLQKQSVALFEKLYNEASSNEKEIFKGFLDYAEQHLVVIEKFNRFPHRNTLLARETSPEEAEFLTQPGSAF